MVSKYFTHENINKLERIINFIKPKFYNKLTWIVVTTGLLLISKPLWLEILNIIINKNYQLNITNINDILMGFLLVTIGLIYNVITVYFDKKSISYQGFLKEKEIIKKDRGLYNKFIADLPTKGTIEFLRNNDFYNIFNDSNIEPLYKIESLWDNAEYRFITPDIEIRKKELLENIHIFLEVVSAKTIYTNDFKFRHLNKNQNTYNQNMKDAKILNDLATNIFNTHQKFVIESNKKLI